jgi:FixJ family two-component response regulator
VNHGVVYIIDDDVAIRDSLSSLLRSTGLDTKTFAKAQEFLATLEADGPSCLLLDVRLRGPSGFIVQSELHRRAPDMPVIFITGHGDISMSVQAMKAGAFDFLTKPFRDQDLVDVVGHALQIHEQRLAERKCLFSLESHYKSLTRRQQEVLALILDGFSTKQIAKHLQLSDVTVKIHRRDLMSKMNSTSIADLVKKALRLGFTYITK